MALPPSYYTVKDLFGVRLLPHHLRVHHFLPADAGRLVSGK